MQAKATAPARKIGSPYSHKTDPLKWIFPDDQMFANIEATTTYDKLIEWLQFFQTNLATIGFHNSVSDLPQIKGSALIIDKSMASTKYHEQLPEIKNYKGTILCCDRSLYSIIKYRLPEYVCQLDSSFLCVDFFDRPDVKAVMDKIAAIFAVTTNTLTIRHWHGKKFFFTPYLGSLSLTKALMIRSGMPYLPTGGQVASFAYILAYNLGANPIGIFGVSLGYDSISETEYPDIPHKRKRGLYGDVWTDPVYEWYNSIYLSYIQAAAKKGVTTVNTMKGGLLYDGKYVKDVSLKEFIEHG